VNYIPFELPGFRLTAVESRADVLLIQAEAKRTGVGCPECRRWSRSIHSHYLRRPHDLPTSGKAIRLTLRVRRFRCRNPKCSREIFCERLPEIVGVSAQRTERLKSVLKRVGWALGGEAGSRLSHHLGMRASPTTVLRQMRSSPLPVQPTPRVLGVDDFALRKGRSYGTLLVDGETHRPVDLLPDRTSETLANWLRDHPGVEVITRDRSTEYARGASQGAPLATQIADRWHLLVNWREALERTLDRFRFQIVDTLSSIQEVIPLTSYDRSGRRGTKDQAQQQASRARRYALFIQVKNLQRKGLNISQIARQLKLSRHTVRKYRVSEVFPESRSTRQKSMLDPYVHYLQARWEEGMQDYQQLWQELRDQGYPGSVRMVWLWVTLRREPLTRGRLPAREVTIFTAPDSSLHPLLRVLPASRRLVWLLIHPADQLNEQQQFLRQHLLAVPELYRSFELTQRFLAIIRQRKADELQPWLTDCQNSALPDLVSFAHGLQQEFPIVLAALQFSFSNGLTEGHVNRLKTIKRSMYGRANFDLLRRRVLIST
jgi:transposase